MLTRRESLGALAAGAVLPRLVVGSVQNAAGANAQSVPAFAGQHEIVPLPFDPKSLKGISEALIVSHHDNNYAAAVRNLNKVEQELATLTADTPGFVVGGLQQSALQFANSKLLHEHYFANLGGDGKATGAISEQLTARYGSVDRWEKLFRATGMSLAGGSGWVTLGYDLSGGAVSISWSGNHTQALASSLPLLVMDMYEHAYQMDYGAAAAKYVDAFFANINWAEVNRRLESAKKADAARRS